MAHMILKRPFDYRHASGCVTAFRETHDVNGEPIVYTVKREILDHAVAIKCGVDADEKRATPKSDVVSAQDRMAAKKNEITGIGPTDPKEI